MVVDESHIEQIEKSFLKLRLLCKVVRFFFLLGLPLILMSWFFLGYLVALHKHEILVDGIGGMTKRIGCMVDIAQCNQQNPLVDP